jgi:asparagine synthase (glutamine-hydrolysing)
MCGIAGIWDRSSGHSDTLGSRIRQMTGALAHRGPDGEGAFIDLDTGLALGHRRLAIIDLSEHGRQPMTSADGRWTISYNGEIYNYRDIRAELEVLGHLFSGDSDTEVLLEACARWGVEQALSRMAGMFALALWDSRERRLFLARDRIGIKPLYWARVGSQILWASELSAITAVAANQLHQDQDAVAGLFRFGYVPAPLTIWREARKLAPGTLLVLDEKGAMRESTYWTLAQAIEEGRRDIIHDERTAADTLDALLRRVVSEHMISDVPLGAFLSGGIDSSLITGVMQAVSPRPVKTFSIGFGSKTHDEAPYARAVANHLKTDHSELYVSEKQAIDVVAQLGTMFDEPFADSSQIPTYLVSRMTRNEVTVALSGDGGDEVFAGYSRYLRSLALRQKLNRLAPARMMLSPLAGLAAAGTRSIGQLTASRRLQRFQHYAEQTSDNLFYRDTVSHALDVFWPDGKATEKRLAGFWPRIDALFPPNLSIQMMQYLDTLTYLPDDILTKVDRTSMAVSLETRVPLLDHRVVELAWRLAPELKFHAGHGKRILRQVLSRYVPEKLYDRPKKGFAVPLHDWLRGPLRPWAEELLQKDRLEAAGITRPEAIQQRWASVIAGDPSFVELCWIALSLSNWHQSLSRPSH